MPMHTVKPGENLSTIAAQYPGMKWEDIYNHKANAEYFKNRGKDHIYPGDQIFIPENISLRTGAPNVLKANPFQRVSGFSKVTPDVAFAILENLSKQARPWRPDLGLGGAAWFTIEGNPHVGVEPTKTIEAHVDLLLPQKPETLGESELLELYNKEKAALDPTSEANYRQFNKIPANQKLTPKQLNGLEFYRRTAPERKMWVSIGEKVARSQSKVAVIILESGSQFSRSGPGKFVVIADATKIFLKNNSPDQIVEALRAQGLTAEPVVVEAAEKLAQKLKWAGRVRGVFRWGGRVFLVVGLAADAFKIYRAQDKVKATVTTVGGWSGASAGMTAFAAFWTPADVAGPWAWAVHGVGTLVAGGVGYWVGSEVTRTIYELVLED